MLERRADQRMLDEKLTADAVNAGLMTSRYKANTATSTGVFNKLI